VKQGPPEVSKEEETGSMANHNEDSVLHILSDLAKGKKEMKETFAQGQRKLIDTLAQLLSPLGNIQGLNTNGGNGQTRSHAEGNNSENGQTRSQQREITVKMGSTVHGLMGATTGFQKEEAIPMCPGRVSSPA
jgi:hypothetical protein